MPATSAIKAVTRSRFSFSVKPCSWVPEGGDPKRRHHRLDAEVLGQLGEGTRLRGLNPPGSEIDERRHPRFACGCGPPHLFRPSSTMGVTPASMRRVAAESPDSARPTMMTSALVAVGAAPRNRPSGPSPMARPADPTRALLRKSLR